jgi:hypothetical protein
VFEFGESGVVDETTASSLATDQHGPLQDDQVVKTKPSRGAACGFWIRAWGQREPADQGAGRLKGPVRWRNSFKGGLDISSFHGQFSSLYREHPAGRGRTKLRHALSESVALSLIR